MQQQNRDGFWEMVLSRWAGQQERWGGHVESQWNPKSSLQGSWLLLTGQRLDLCCPQGLVKCPTTPLTPRCRWATLVVLNKATINELLQLGGFCLATFCLAFFFLSSCFCSGTPERFIETTSKGLRVEGMDVLSWPLAPGFVRLVFITAGETTAMLRSNSKKSTVKLHQGWPLSSSSPLIPAPSLPQHHERGEIN